MKNKTFKAAFNTVGELKSLLNNIPNNVPVYVTGVSGGLYMECDETGACTAVSFDEESYIESIEPENA